MRRRPTSGRGRRGRRTAAMIRLAGERIGELFALAESESRRGTAGYADRYVSLARRIGMRYTVRILPELRELYCRRCSAYWVEGRTVRTRLRTGRRVRTCLRCGARRRVPLGPRSVPPLLADAAAVPGRPAEPAPVDDGDAPWDAELGEDP